MNIVVVTRCLNGQEHIERFAKGYDFCDQIIVSDGGSTDDSLELLGKYPRIRVVDFEQREIIDGHTWNPDNHHIQHAIDSGLETSPDFLMLDDIDDVPNFLLRENARKIIENCKEDFVFAFRLYLWGNEKFFPKMNNHFDSRYRSLWGWFPDRVSVWTDKEKKHGTLVMDMGSVLPLELPMCLLHRSWHPDTIQAKIDRYNAIGLPMEHPLNFAGELAELPDWAREE